MAAAPSRTCLTIRHWQSESPTGRCANYHKRVAPSTTSSTGPQLRLMIDQNAGATHRSPWRDCRAAELLSWYLARGVLADTGPLIRDCEFVVFEL